jgi:hypothetical protein
MVGERVKWWWGRAAKGQMVGRGSNGGGEGQMVEERDKWWRRGSNGGRGGRRRVKRVKRVKWWRRRSNGGGEGQMEEEGGGSNQMLHFVREEREGLVGAGGSGCPSSSSCTGV